MATRENRSCGDVSSVGQALLPCAAPDGAATSPRMRHLSPLAAGAGEGASRAIGRTRKLSPDRRGPKVTAKAFRAAFQRMCQRARPRPWVQYRSSVEALGAGFALESKAIPTSL
jgi:hypothetical protein